MKVWGLVRDRTSYSTVLTAWARYYPHMPGAAERANAILQEHSMHHLYKQHGIVQAKPNTHLYKVRQAEQALLDLLTK
jgi:hypothetical protein